MKRCAIYTRKSTEEGLDQAFNSLDAQREACENYILSQKSEGWRAIKTKYDDGGLSGGNMERPALRALMQDIDDGKVDIVVVYKVDRLTRSLADFAKLVECFDKHEVSFVSVTQQFNTSNSMGRLTLNVLLSFAQFEREVGAERVRDKIAASRKKGIWTGGNPPLGYENIDRKLVLVEKEAKIVREIYGQYFEKACVRAIIKHANEQGWVTKRRANGSGGKRFSRGPIYHILKNPIYAGLMKTGGKLYDGQHNAIVDRKTWDAVQIKLAERTQWTGTPKSKISPLAGLLYWNGERLTPSHTTRGRRRHRYYISHANKTGVQDRVRLRADDIEAALKGSVIEWISDSENAASEIAATGASAKDIQAIRRLLKQREETFRTSGSLENLTPFFTRTDLCENSIAITADTQRLVADADYDHALKAEAIIRSPVSVKSRGQELRLLLGESDNPQLQDETAIAFIAKISRWKQKWFEDPDNELRSILSREGVALTGYSRGMRLAFLAPDIVEAIFSGRAPIDLNTEKLKRLKTVPANWDEQHKLLDMSV